MAAILQVDPNATRGQQVLNAIAQIQQGLGTLRTLDGLRAEAIAVNGAEVQAIFGVQGASTGLAFSDRWSALLALIDEDDTGAQDFLNAVTYTYS